MQNQDQQPDNRSFIDKMNDRVSMAYVISGIIMLSVTPWIRNRHGTHAFQWFGPFCLLYLLLYGSLANQPEVILYIPFWLLAIIVRRITADRREISTYMGWPWLATKIPFIRREEQGRAMEALMVGALGLYLVAMEIRFGTFLCVAATAMQVHEVIDRAARSARDRQREDFIKMQEIEARRWR